MKTEKRYVSRVDRSCLYRSSRARSCQSSNPSLFYITHCFLKKQNGSLLQYVEGNIYSDYTFNNSTARCTFTLLHAKYIIFGPFSQTNERRRKPIYRYTDVCYSQVRTEREDSTRICERVLLDANTPSNIKSIHVLALFSGNAEKLLLRPKTTKSMARAFGYLRVVSYPPARRRWLRKRR